MTFYCEAFVFLSLSCVMSSFANFSPFMDSELFLINWAGPMPVEKFEFPSSRLVTVLTNNKEKYHCILPEERLDDNNISEKDQTQESSEEIMQRMFDKKICSYRIESFWTYELCHGKYMRQYHESKDLGKKRQLQEYYLGYNKGSNLERSGATKVATSSIGSPPVHTRKVDGLDLPYFQVNITDGTFCDLTGGPRQAAILYVCQPEGRGEILEMKEVSTCEYEIIVLTSVLCNHPDFKPKNPHIGKIDCHSAEGAPIRPVNMDKLTEESRYGLPFEDESSVYKLNLHEKRKYTSKPEEVQGDYQKPKGSISTGNGEIGLATDEQTIRDFLSGNDCLKGGAGWWKHEFCYGKYVRQYHDGTDGRTVITLGHWDLEKHINWLNANPLKKPKPVGKRRSISLFYTEGDFCEASGKKRVVEVKLKCIEDLSRSHSFALYIMEPKTCEYILGIESTMFCSLLDKADDYGVMV
ncbi:endoplasmic reticulum lectin 1-like [Argonauta hians]